MTDKRSGVKTINLALQGGGSHGAFTWGVMDRLLEEDSIAIEGIVGTSAGALNGAVAAYGIALGGNAGAREALAAFWRRVADDAKFSPLQPTWLDQKLSPGNLVLAVSTCCCSRSASCKVIFSVSNNSSRVCP